MFALVSSLAQARTYTKPKDIADIVYNLVEIQQRLNAFNAITSQKIKVNKIEIHRALQDGENCFYAYSVEFGSMSKEDEALVGKSYWANNDKDGRNSKCFFDGN
jgi:hypothetical protein